MRRCWLCRKPVETGNGTFFNVPKDVNKREEWNKLCQMEFTPNARICVDHFLSSDIITAGRRLMLMPNAMPIVQQQQKEVTRNSGSSFCALSCPYPKNLYAFPCRKNEASRRKLWLDFFDMEEPNTEDVFACERHFSRIQTTKTGIRIDAIPDLSPLYDTIKSPFRRKTKNTRPIVTPNCPVNIVCEDVLGENLVNIDNNVKQEKSLLQMSFDKAESKTICTQTNTRLCGTVEVSGFADDYRFNCFYCCQTFPLEKWNKFMAHLKERHFEYEEAFEICKYVSDDHDYTPINAKLATFVKPTPVMNSSKIETLLIAAKPLLPHLVDPLETSFSMKKENLAPANNTDTSISRPASSLDVVKPIVDKDNAIISSNNEKKKLIKKRNFKAPSKNAGKNKQKILPSGVLYINDIKRQTSNRTALSRCLKRSNTIEPLDPAELEESFTNQSFQQRTTELTFEYTPRDIIDFLLDNIKNYPVLWHFDEISLNKDYCEAIKMLCHIINEKWSLNIDSLKMRRSVNRVLRFYCSLYPCENLENINQFTYYYDKCALFLPASVHEIAYARCSQCYKCYKSDSELKAHLLDEQKCLQWPYKCIECKECFRDNDEYEFHKRLPHYQEVFRCELCTKRFTRRNKYNRHVLTHQLRQSAEPGKYVCNVCGKVYKLSSELHNHKIYHGEKKHKCHLCQKKFYTNALLVKHIEAHNKEYRLMCEVCGKGFINHNSLREHMNKHTGAKVTCNICNLKLRKSSLNRHLRLVHVACEGTIETTYRARNHHYRSLLLHPSKRRFNKRSNYKNYGCKICNIPFERLKFLLIHNKEVHSDAPKFSCKVCGTKLKNKFYLKRHYRGKHDFHVYQVYKLVEKNEDLDTVLAINKEELDKLCETLAYSLQPEPATNNPISMEGDQLFDSELIETEIIRKVEDNNTSDQEIKIDDDHYMNDFFTNL